MLEYLVEEAGVSEVEAPLKMRDGDLWILHPEQRFAEELEGEEGVRAWEDAELTARNIANTVSNGAGSIQASPALTQLIWDAHARAEEALRRARERAGEEADKCTG